MGFFDSPRQTAGKEMFGDFQKDVENFDNPFAKTQNIGDVYKNYGVKQFDAAGYADSVRRSFDPARRNLASRKTRSLNAAVDSTGRSATPGMSFSKLEGDYALAGGDLEGRQAIKQTEGFDKANTQSLNIAGLFKGLQDSNVSAQGQKLRLKGQGIQNYLSSLSDSSQFDDMLAGVGTAAKIYTGGFGPSSITNNFGKS